MSEPGHLPVMVNEVLEYLCRNNEGAYLDLTVGLGGHLKAVCETVSENASLYGIDRDPNAVGFAGENLKNCKQLKKLEALPYGRVIEALENFENRTFDGILMDLGVSSYQIDSPERGFSFRHDAPLDMRFDKTSMDITASDIINSADQKELARIFSRYGEERQSMRIAKSIVESRKKSPILTTIQLKELIERTVSRNLINKTLARIFQALRIAVNDELGQLESTLPKLPALLNSGGRLVILTYHSLEDRIVKRFIAESARGCICPDHYNVCVCGHEPSLRVLTRKAVLPLPGEIENNSRARSAKLRAAEKI